MAVLGGECCGDGSLVDSVTTTLALGFKNDDSGHPSVLVEVRRLRI